MEQQIIDIETEALQDGAASPGWIAAIEAAKVLHFPHRPFAVTCCQYALEQTCYLPAGARYDTASSPLAILTRLTGRTLI